MEQKDKNIRVAQSPEALALAVTEFITEVAKDAVSNKGRFTMMLSGGETPKTLFSLLSEAPFCNEIPWANTFIFWGDERCVPLNDPQNNAYLAKRLLLDKVAIPEENINPIPVDLLPADAAIAYANTIKKFFRGEAPEFDLILLGLGDNGHTASLFPESEIDLATKDLVIAVFVKEQNMWRISVTPFLLNQAANIAFMVQGTSKAEILDKVLHAPNQRNQYPAQRIQPEHGTLTWFVDRRAATL